MRGAARRQPAAVPRGPAAAGAVAVAAAASASGALRPLPPVFAFISAPAALQGSRAPGLPLTSPSPTYRSHNLSRSPSHQHLYQTARPRLSLDCYKIPTATLLPIPRHLPPPARPPACLTALPASPRPLCQVAQTHGQRSALLSALSVHQALEEAIRLVAEQAFYPSRDIAVFGLSSPFAPAWPCPLCHWLIFSTKLSPIRPIPER